MVFLGDVNREVEGQRHFSLDQLTRVAGRLGQLAAQLGLSPSAERALRHDAALEVSHRKWLALAEDREVVPAQATPASASAPEASANGTPQIPGFTSRV